MSIDSNKNAAWVADLYSKLRDAIASVVIGQDDAIRLSFTTLLCSGHSLYEGVPGVAKTLLVRTIAATLWDPIRANPMYARSDAQRYYWYSHFFSQCGGVSFSAGSDLRGLTSGG